MLAPLWSHCPMEGVCVGGNSENKISNSAFNGKAAAAILLTPIAKRKKLIGGHLPGLFGYGPRPRNYGTVILTAK